MSNFLKCDEANCDHMEDVDAMTEALVNKPCPKCGANLLTQDDFDNFKAIKALTDSLAELFPPEEGEDLVEMTVGVHDGKMTLETKDVK